MAYLFLVLSSVLDGIKGCMAKPLSRHASTLKDAMLINLCRTVLCCALGFAFCLITEGRGPALTRGALLSALLGGVSNALLMISWLSAMRAGAFMTLSVLASAATILPVLLTAILYGETILPHHLIGLAILVIASWLGCSYQRNIKGKASPRLILDCVTLFVSVGLLNFSQKVFVHTEPDGSVPSFNFLIYAVSFLALLVFLPLGKKEGAGTSPARLLRETWLPMVLMSVFLYFVSYFRTLAAAAIPAGVFFPTSGGVTMAVNLTYSAVSLKEKPTPKCIAGILLTLVSLVLVNL